MSGLYDLLDGTQPCRNEPHLFFPKPGGGGSSRAKAVCRHCPFQPACLQYALIYDLAGVWGGATQKERRAYQKARGIHPIPVTIPRALTKQNGPK